MNLRKRILDLLRQPDYLPATRDELVAKVAGKKKSLAGEAAEEIESMLASGQLVRIKKNRLCLPVDADLVSGKIIFRQSGAAILIPDPPPDSTESPEAVRIRAEDTWVAMHGDRVVARYSDPPQRQRHPRNKRGGGRDDDSARHARVIRILERARDTITGTLEKSRLFHYVIPDDPRIIQDIYVQNAPRSKVRPRPKVGDKVVVKLHEWKQRHINPEGEIVEILGKTHEPGAELKAIFRKFNLDPEFPEAVVKEVAAFPDSVRRKDLTGRLDLRKVFTLTIDPDDAKDFDDALSIEPLAGGNFRVGIHIADVSAYVNPDSPLDKEAKKRGNSTYLVGTVIPMLPHKLSNGLCSLVENEDRLTKSALLTVTPQGKVIEAEYANSVIRSSKRLTYRQAHAFLKENDFRAIRRVPLPPAHQTGSTGRSLEDLDDVELRRIQDTVRQLWVIASKVREKRMNTGALDLDMPETKIFVDEEGYADRLEIIEYDESHQLIEEFMLMANEAVAADLTRARMPAIYRVHEEPDGKKLVEYREFLADHGIRTGDLTNRKEIKKVLQTIKTHPQGHILRIQFLRSLRQAKYLAAPKGHYGLNKKNYTHFTSPIRRYSDLVVHRLLETFLVKHRGEKPLPGKNRHYTQGELNSVAEHLSVTEQNSTEAEREHVKQKLLEFFEREMDKPEKTRFPAIITDVKNHGMFIELKDSQAFGLIHISTMRDDHYQINADGNALIGRRTKRKYENGQQVEVVTERVDRFKRQIDFRLVEHQNDRPGKGKKR